MKKKHRKKTEKNEKTYMILCCAAHLLTTEPEYLNENTNLKN